MRFQRSLRPATQCSARGEKCPESVRKSIDADPMKFGYYLQLWSASDQSWGNVVAYERKFGVDTSGTKFIEEWLTIGQLTEIYKDKKVVQAIGVRVERGKTVCALLCAFVPLR